MLDSFIHSITAKLGAVWRVFGSPRIAGDKKAVGTLKSAWVNRALPKEQVSILPRWAKLAIFTTSGLVVVVVAIWLLMSIFGGDGEDNTAADGPPTPTPFAGPDYMTEVQALSLAVVAARDAGLVSQDFSHVARRLQFIDYATAIGEANRADRGLLETPSDTEIWAFAFVGDVRLELDNGDKVQYDNLTVVLDALTGTIYRAEAFYGEYESEARAPVWLRPPTPTAVPRQP